MAGAPDAIVEMAKWVAALEKADDDKNWAGVGTVADAIRKFLETHEATGPAKVFADVEGKAGG
ncbi:MAG TPA: hypothetical protein VF077_08870 [Nitrospiraceae bacterium]